MLEADLTAVRAENNKKGISLGYYNDGVSACGRGCKTSVIDWHDNTAGPQEKAPVMYMAGYASNDGWITVIRYGLSSSKRGISV